MCENSTSRCKTDAHISEMFVGVINKKLIFLPAMAEWGKIELYFVLSWEGFVLCNIQDEGNLSYLVRLFFYLVVINNSVW